eukprot:SAG11_NODE_10120_length_853_cov_1.444297_1_plen_31_part_10
MQEHAKRMAMGLDGGYPSEYELADKLILSKV